MLRRLFVERRLGSSAPIIPRATTAATVRVSGEFTTFSNAVGSGFDARVLVRVEPGIGARPASTSASLPASAAVSAAIRFASNSRALSRSIGVAYSLTCADDDNR